MTSKKSSIGRRLKGILIPVSSGKSKLADLVHGLDSKKRDVIFIDIDASLLPVEGGSSIDLFPRAKELIQKKYKEYPKHTVVVLSSNEQLFKFLKISSQKTTVFVPQTAFFLKMLLIRKLLLPAVPGTQFSQPEVITENLSSGNEIKKKKSFSLGKETGATQKVKDLSKENIKELFDNELEVISESRDSLLKRKHIKFESFADLKIKVQKTLLRLKDLD